MFAFFVFMGLVASSCCTPTSSGLESTSNSSKRDITPRALSGSTTSIYNTRYKAHLEWVGTQNPSSLSTTVTVTFYIESLNALNSLYNQYPSGDNAPILTINIDETTVLNEVKTFDFREKYVGYTDARGSGSKTVSHDVYGSAKSISISASFDTRISTQEIISISDTASLDAVPVSVTVNFNGNGGTASKSSMTVTYNNKYGDLPTASRTGYSQTGWFTATSGGTQITSESTVSVIGTQNLYAQWTANPYTVNFNGNGGNISESTITVTYDNKYGTLPTATRTGYSFIGWFTATSGGTEITSDSTVSITATQTLYAQWIINNYTLTFNFDNGTDPEVGILSFNSTIEYPENITKEGHIFNGWDRNDTRMPAHNLTITALWIINNYTLTFNFDNGTDPEVRILSFNSTIEYPENITKEGYIFNGWDRMIGNMPAHNLTITVLWTEEPKEFVEIMFGKKIFKKEEAEKIIKKYTDEEFTIEDFEIDEKTGETRIIILFSDTTKTEEFVRKINEIESASSNFIRRANGVDHKKSISSISSPFSFLVHVFY